MTHFSIGYLFSLATISIGLSACAMTGSGGDWTKLIDGATGLENFNRIGEANWIAADGAIQASQGAKPTYLVSKESYGDFQIQAEFWASDDANSGVFLRCQNPAEVTDESCYEVNIFDQRPDPSYGTGAIVKVAQIADPKPKAGGKWNTYDITAKGSHLTVVLNGVKTVDVENSKLTSGPVALQWVQGTIKFRKLAIRPL